MTPSPEHLEVATAAQQTSAVGTRKHHARWLPILALLALVCAVNVALMPGGFVGGDAISWHEEARSLVRDGHLAVDPELARHVGEPGEVFVFNDVDGQWYSKHGIANSWMAVPEVLAEKLATGRIPSPGQVPNLLVVNLYNVALSLALCAVLYALSARYSRHVASRVVFTLACLYATYLWYYQRAQMSEIYQTLFFCGAFALLAAFLRDLREHEGRASGRGRAALVGAWALVGALVLCRLLFALAIPIVAVAAACVIAALPRERRRSIAFSLAPWILVPPALILAALAWVDLVKFGSMWLTGYHQWKPREHGLTGRISEGVMGFVFDRRFSILLHFPVLVLAIAGFRAFFARHLSVAIAMLSSLVLFLSATAMIPTWRGEWTYGPRYMLFILPVLSLPALCCFDDIVERWGSLRSSLLAAAAAVLLGWSMLVQARVIRCEFFLYYFVREAIPAPLDGELAEYFHGHSLGTIYGDLLAHRADPENLPFFPAIRKATSAARAEAYLQYLVKLLSGNNFYWCTRASEPVERSSR
jgi:hypothetical protein